MEILLKEWDLVDLIPVFNRKYLLIHKFYFVFVQYSKDEACTPNKHAFDHQMERQDNFLL